MTHLEQTESSTSRVIIGVWRAILPVGCVWRVVMRVITVAGISDGESGSGDSDNDEGGTTKDRHDRRRG